MARFVLVHGGFSGAWIWLPLMDRLKAAGHVVEAFDLPGMGDDHTSASEVSLDSYARGILEGESVPDIFIPQLIELNAQGRFPFEKLIKSIRLRKTVKEGAQSNPSFAYHRPERGRKLHVTGHKSGFLPRAAWPE